MRDDRIRLCADAERRVLFSSAHVRESKLYALTFKLVKSYNESGGGLNPGRWPGSPHLF